MSLNPIRPDSTWSLERLEEYALARAETIAGFGRRTISETWLLGESLSLIQNMKKKEGAWIDWVKTQNFSLSTATNAIKLYERIAYHDLESCNGMTVSDLKASLDIIKRPPVKKRNSTVATPSVGAKAGEQPSTIPFSQRTDSDVPDSVTVETAGISPERANGRVTVTDYSRNGRKTAEPVVGADLTTSEVLGQILNQLLTAERLGITPDCSDLLDEIEAKIAFLKQGIAAVVSA